MPEFLKVNATESDPIIRWINLEAVMFVTSTKTQQGDRLNIKFIDSTNLVINGELAKELKMDEGNDDDYSDEAEYEEADEYKDKREAIDALHGFNTDWRDYLDDYDRQFIDQ